MTFNTARTILAIKFYGTEEGKEINKILNQVDDDPWHTGTPTEIEDDEYWAWNYALVLNTEYDCIGNYLAGLLFKPDFDRQVFEAPLDNGKEFIVPFSEVVAWQKITPFEEKEDDKT